MLWNSIYEFFVKHVFGGALGSGSQTTYYQPFAVNYYNGSAVINKTLNNIEVNMLGQNMSLSNYLCILATMISISVIVILCCLFIARLVRLVGRLFSGGTL